MTPRGSLENSKNEFPTLPTALGNPAQNAGFPHSTATTTAMTIKILPHNKNQNRTDPVL